MVYKMILYFLLALRVRMASATTVLLSTCVVQLTIVREMRSLRLLAPGRMAAELAIRRIAMPVSIVEMDVCTCRPRV